MARSYGLATQSYAISHPSLPNYLTLSAGSTFGITSDCTTCWVNAGNLAVLLARRGETSEAEDLYRRALSIKERVLGADNDEVATLATSFGLDVHAIDEILLNGVRQSFLPDGRKKELEAAYRAELDGLKSVHLRS